MRQHRKPNRTGGGPRLAALLLAACGLTFQLQGCGGSDPAALIAKAQEHRKGGDLQAASIELKNALQKDPENGEARYQLGSLLLEAGEVAAAENELRRALERGADPAKVWPELARTMLLQGKFEKLLEETDAGKAPKLQEVPEVLNARGLAMLALAKPMEALETLNRALELRPGFADALLSKARLAAAQRDADGAFKLIEEAIAGSPNNAEAWLLKGDLNRILGRNDEAIQSYRKAAELKPGDSTARLNLAAMLIASAKYDDATKELDAAKTGTGPRALSASFLHSLMEFRRGNYQAASDRVQQVLKAAPGHLPSVLLAGATEYALGHLEQAETHLRQVVEKAPNNLYARKLLAATLLKNGQVGKAIATLEPVMERAGQDPTLLSIAAEAYMQDGQHGKATDLFEKAATLDPRNPGLRTRLGVSRLAAGENDRAIAELESAAELDVGGQRADILLVMWHVRQRQFDDALKAVTKLEEKQPKNPLTFNLKAAALLGKKDLSGARRNLERAIDLDPTYFPAAANLAQLDAMQGDVKGAKGRYEKVLEKSPQSIDAMLALARIAAQEGKPDEVLSWLNKAKQAKKDSTAPWLAEAGYMMRVGNPEKALEAAREAYTLRPTNPDVLDTLGQAQLAVGQHSEALVTFSRLTALRPDSAVAHFRVAAAQMANKNALAAAQSLRKAIELQPGYREAQVALAGVEVSRGRHAEALKIARDIQKEAPKHPLGALIEGDVLMAEKKPADAAAAYERAYQQGRSAEAAVKAHRAWTAAGQPAKGNQRIQEWLKAEPGDVMARLYLADTALQEKKYPEAVAQYREVLKKTPQNVLVLNNLAWALGEMNDPAAKQYAEQAIKLRPEDPAVMDTVGWVLLRQSETARGLDLLQKAATKASSNMEIRYHLAQGYAKVGEKDKAISELERILVSGVAFNGQQEATDLLRQLRGSGR